MTDATDDVSEILIEALAGEPITLPFPKGPATGYEWQWTLPAGVTRLPDLPGPPQPELIVGAPDGALPQLLAQDPGEYQVYGEFGRPWENAPERSVTITLQIR